MAANRRSTSGSTGDEGVENGSVGFSRGLLLSGAAVVALALLPFAVGRAGSGSDGGTDIARPQSIAPAQESQDDPVEAAQDEAPAVSNFVPQSGVTDDLALPFGIPDKFLPLTETSFARLAETDPGLVSPSNRSIVTEASPAFSGVATDSSGVSSVSVVIVSASLNRQWSREPIRADLEDPGAASTGWTLDPEAVYIDRPVLWTGQYLIAITTVGADGEADVAYGQFWVERRGPLIEIGEPLGNEILTSAEVVVAGSARDDVELALVEVALVDESGNWLQPDGRFRGRRTDIPAETTGLGVPAADWSLTVTMPAPGRFTVFVTAYAWNGGKSVQLRTFDYDPSHVGEAAGDATILMARSLIGTPQKCGRNPSVRSDSISLTSVAEALAARGFSATGTVTPERHAESVATCHSYGTTTASWNTINGLRDDHGWTFVSHGQTYASMDGLSSEEQTDESCGSLKSFADRGHDDAWGLFAYPGNKFSEDAQANVVSTCFAYSGVYGVEYNATDTLASQRSVTVFSVNGGHCNDFGEDCYNANLMNAGRRYVPPSELVRILNVPKDRWAIVQFYRFVTGANESGFERWDCSDADANRHWTNNAELYCWTDFLAVIDSIDPGVRVTDPASIARAYGNDIAEHAAKNDAEIDGGTDGETE